MFNFVNLFKLILRIERDSQAKSYGFSFGFFIRKIFLFIFFGSLILINQAFLLLDEILFFPYRLTKIKAPLLIIGVPRTGTTFLFRTMANDRKNFTHFTLAEIIFAPSLIQKFLFYSIYRIDKSGGSPLKKIVLKIQTRSNDGYEKIHPYDLFGPEEDELLLLHTFSSLVLKYFFPKSKVFDKYIHFDEEVNPQERKRIFRYKKNCYKKHLFFWQCVSGKEKTLLFKNPIFSPKTDSVFETFPDIRIIYTRRSAEQVVPSMISMNAAILKKMHYIRDEYPDAHKAKEVILEWMSLLDQKLKNREAVFICEFSDLVSDIKKVTKDIYQKFELETDARFDSELNLLFEQQKNYRSEHEINNEKITEILSKENENNESA